MADADAVAVVFQADPGHRLSPGPLNATPLQAASLRPAPSRHCRGAVGAGPAAVGGQGRREARAGSCESWAAGVRGLVLTPDFVLRRRSLGHLRC